MGTMWDLVGQCIAPFSPGDVTKHPHGPSLVNRLSRDEERSLSPALHPYQEVGAPWRPKRGTSRSIVAWPLRYDHCWIALAAYLAEQVRATISVRERTRTGRLWLTYKSLTVLKKGLSAIHLRLTLTPETKNQ